MENTENNIIDLMELDTAAYEWPLSYYLEKIQNKDNPYYEDIPF